MNKHRLAVLASHPIQNQAPLYRKLASHPEVDLTVFYCSDQGVSGGLDPGFGIPVRWDIPMLDGYRHKFVGNLRRCPLGGFASLVNPGLIPEIAHGRFDALLLHGHAYVSDWIALLAAHATNTPLLYRSESSLTYDQRVRRGLLVRMLKPAVLRFLFRQVSCFLAIGSLNAEFYLHFGARPDQVFHVPYAVDNEYFSSRTAEHRLKRDEIRKSLGIRPEDVVFLFAAKMTPKKAPLELLEAYSRLGNRDGVALVLAGDGELRQSAEQFARSRTLRGVHFTGFVNQSELPRYYAISDVFVRPDGIYQGDWGLTVNEAMAAGLAIIATDSIGATRDLVRQGENGLVVRFGDLDDLASAMGHLAQDGTRCARMGRRSEEIIATWSYEECVQGILKALRSLRAAAAAGPAFRPHHAAAGPRQP